MARVDTLPQVPFPLPDPAIVLQDVWITQGGRDFSISPTRLGSIQQGTIAPVNPFENQLWWDSSGTLVPGQTILRAWQKGAWVEVGPFGDQFGNVKIPGTLDVVGGKISGANPQGYLEIASNLQVDGGTIAGPNQGPLAIASDLTVGGKLTVDGTSTLKGATIVTGGLTSDTLTTSGAATIGGLLTTQTITITGTGAGATGGFQANTGTFSGFVTVNGTLTANSGLVWKGGATGDTLTLNGTAPQLTLSNGTSNWIQYGNAGVSPPTLSTHSPGTKLLFEPIASPTSYDYAIGLQFGAIWFSAAAYAFYGLNGSPAYMSVDTNGNLAITSPTTVFNGNLAGPGGVLTVSGELFATTNIEASGRVHALTSVVDENANVGGILTVIGAAGVSGEMNIGGGLNVQGGLPGSDLTLLVHGNADVNGVINGGAANIAGVINGGAANIAGAAHIGGTINITGGVVGNLGVSGNVNIDGSLDVSSFAVIRGNLTIEQILSVVGSMGITGSSNLVGGLDVSGIYPGTGGNTLVVNGATYCNGSLTTTGAINVAGLNSVFQQGLVVTAASGHFVALETNGDLEVFGDAFANSWQINPSAAALKRDVGGFGRGLDAIRTLRPVSYRLERSPRRLHGLIAEEVETAIPEAVGHGSKPDSKTLDVMVLISTLINGVRELGDKVEKLENELERVQSSPRQ